MRISPTRSLIYIQKYPLDVVITLLNLLVPFTVIVVMVSGDQMQATPPQASLRVAWRLLDPLIHITIGFLVITPFIIYQPATPKRVFFALCLVMLSISPDMDHILAAGSLSLQSITRVIPRTPSHAFFNALVVGLAAWLLSRKFRTGWLFFAVITSHFIRDAYTGGMLLFPWSTLPFKFSIAEYRSLVILLYMATNLIMFSETTITSSTHGRWWRVPALPRKIT